MKMAQDYAEDDAFRQRVLPKAVLNRVMRTVDPKKLGNVHVRGKGCEKCAGRGIIGQTVAPRSWPRIKSF